MSDVITRSVVTLLDVNFEELVLQSKKPALVDFWAEWCAPCRMLAPTVEKLAEDYGDKILVGKLNVDANPATTSQYNIRGVPALLLFKEGRLIRRILGVQSKEQIKEAIEEYL